VLAADPSRGDQQAHLTVARVAEQPPASTPTSLLVRTRRATTARPAARFSCARKRKSFSAETSVGADRPADLRDSYNRRRLTLARGLTAERLRPREERPVPIALSDVCICTIGVLRRRDVGRARCCYRPAGIVKSAPSGRVFATHSADVLWAAGRLHGRDDAQVEPRELDVARRAIASLGRLAIGSPRKPSSRLDPQDDRNAPRGEVSEWDRAPRPKVDLRPRCDERARGCPDDWPHPFRTRAGYPDGILG